MHKHQDFVMRRVKKILEGAGHTVTSDTPLLAKQLLKQAHRLAPTLCWVDGQTVIAKVTESVAATAVPRKDGSSREPEEVVFDMASEWLEMEAQMLNAGHKVTRTDRLSNGLSEGISSIGRKMATILKKRN